MANTFRRVAKWILKNTVTSNQSLTPELRLQLITEASPLWMCQPEMCPFPDPYWAFYWPGGQGITRFILDNKELFHNSHVLDFGCGCGSASIAASQMGATVVADDIDMNALIATWINYRKNGVSKQQTTFSSDNLLDAVNAPSVKHFLQFEKSFITLGDMFYDVEFAEKLFVWLDRMKRATGVRILAGDPDRHPLADEHLRSYSTKVIKQQLALYSLPECVSSEHYGFSCVRVFEFQ